MFQSFLIKYAEIGIKGKNRYLFEDALVHNAQSALDKIDGEFKVTKEYGRIYAVANADYDFDEVVDALQHVFGIVGICPMVQIEDHGFEDLAQQVIQYVERIIQWNPWRLMLSLAAESLRHFRKQRWMCMIRK